MAVHDFNLSTMIRSEPQGGRWRYWLAPALASVDVIVVFGVIFAASFLYHTIVYRGFGNYQVTFKLGTLVTAVFLFTNLMRGRYRVSNYLSTEGQMMEAFSVWNTTMIAFVAIAFLAKVIDEYSRAVVVLSYVVGVPVIALARKALSRAIASASRSGRIATERVVLIGRENDVLNFASRHRPWNTGFIVVDAVFLREPDPNAPLLAREAALQEDLAAAQARIRQLGPDSVFIALPWAERRLIERCVDSLLKVPVSIHLAPEAILDRFRNPRIAHVGTVMSLQLTRPPLTLFEVGFKRAFDFVASGIGLVLLTPLFLLIALAIRAEGPGPVMFAQRRYGFNQQPFRIYKFRSMSCAEDGPKVTQARPNDPRITAIGGFLRRYNLDELPQLLNVFLGQMSLVGPRPHALAHDHEYEEKIALYARRHNVKPGITGWAQVNGHRGLTDTDEKMAKRVEHDLWYIDNWSFWLDIVILMRTFLSSKAFRNAL